MSKQRSSQSTSGRSSQASGTRATTGASEILGGTRAGAPGGATVILEETITQIPPGGASGQSQAAPVTEQAKELAGAVQEKATQKVESGLTKAKGQVAESLHALNQSLLISGQQLRDRNQQNVSRYVDQLANKVESAASYLQNSEITELVDRTEDFARRRPAVFLGGAFVLGLLGARFLKSSRRSAEGGERGGMRGQWREQPRYIRERAVRVREDLAASPAQEEWEELRAAVTSVDLADVPNARVETQSLGESGFGRQREPLEFDLPPGGPRSSQR